MAHSAFRSGGLFALILFCAPSWISAQAYPRDEITDGVDRIFEQWDRPGSPGAVVAVYRNGRIVYARGYGMANLEYDIPLTPSSVLRVGSVSKQFTATAVALLEGQGELSLDDDIRKFLPEIPDYGRTITVRHLVHHTSGLRDYNTLVSLTGRESKELRRGDEALALIARQKGLNFPPGKEYLYSNSGYFLLSLIVERVSGETLAEFARDQIFGPLGMGHSFFKDDRDRIVKNRAQGYERRDDGFALDMSEREFVGAGGVFTTVEDLLLWDGNFYRNELGDGGSKLIETLVSPGRLEDGEAIDYAFGLRVSKLGEVTSVGHGGSWAGFRAGYLRFPEFELSVVVLANLASIRPMALCEDVARLYLGEHLPPKREEAAPVPNPEEGESDILRLAPEDLEAYSGEYESEELQTTYAVRRHDGELSVKRGRAPKESLVPRGQRDHFRADDLEIVFLRDEAAEVHGLNVSAGRVRDLYFEKLAAP